MLLLACAIIEIILKMLSVVVIEFYKFALSVARRVPEVIANVKIISKKMLLLT